MAILQKKENEKKKYPRDKRFFQVAILLLERKAFFASICVPISLAPLHFLWKMDIVNTNLKEQKSMPRHRERRRRV